MPSFLAPIDLNGSELRNAVVQNLAVAPSTAAGKIYYDTALGVMRYRNASSWVDLYQGTPNTLYDANTILKADTDDTPVALTVGASTILGRAAAGGIDALSPSAARTVLGLGALATLSTITSTEITDGTIVNDDINASAGIVLSKLATQAAYTFVGNNTASSAVPVAMTAAQAMATLSGSATATFSLNNQILTGVATPVSSTDAANRAYVDSVATGLDVKASVRVGATAAVTVATPGATIDGVTMSSGDRVLLMGQAAGAENGIWVWNGAAAAMTRATDADASAEVTSGMFTFVEEGTSGGKGFVLTTANPITLGVTSLTFTQFSGAGTITGTTNRITVTGTQIDIAATYVGQTSITTLGTVTSGTWNATDIAVADGGTGASTAAGAKTNLGFMTRYTTTVGNGVLTTFTVTHNLNTEGIVVELYDSSTKQTVYADITRTSVNAISVSGFTAAPATNAVTVVVVG